MAQRGLPYEYEPEEGKSGLTAMGGLPTYLDLASATGLLKSIDRPLKVCTGDQGWTDRQMVMSLVLLNLADGESVDDINKLVLGDSWITKRMKAIRFGLINIAGRVMDHARRLLVRISENHPSGRLLIEARQRIALLRGSPG